MNKENKDKDQKMLPKMAQKKEKKRERRSRNRDISGVGPKVMAPAASARAYQTRDPQIQNNGKICIVKHRELLETITGNTNFQIPFSYQINPGLASSFPWLSGIANQWEQYRFNRLVYHYIPRCSTTKVGSVMLVPDYDVLDAPPQNEREASTYFEAIEDASWREIRCNLQPASLQPMGPKKYVRSGSVSSDLKTYDGGKLYVCVNGQDDTTAIGKLWVEYEVSFYVPQTNSTGIPIPTRAALFDLASAIVLTSGVSVNTNFDAVVTNTLGIVNNAGVYTLPRGSYLITYGVGDGNDASAARLLQTIVVIDGVNVAGSITLQSINGGAGNQVSSQWLVNSSGSTTVAILATCTFAGGNDNLNAGTISFLLV